MMWSEEKWSGVEAVTMWSEVKRSEAKWSKVKMKNSVDCVWCDVKIKNRGHCHDRGGAYNGHRLKMILVGEAEEQYHLSLSGGREQRMMQDLHRVIWAVEENRECKIYTGLFERWKRIYKICAGLLQYTQDLRRIDWALEK
jgi:hypothetical protein